MRVDEDGLLAYLRHRVGETPISSRAGATRKALELNQPRPDFSRTFGNPDISAYVGFIDLANFSETVSGQAPGDIAEFVLPFLRNSIRILRGRHALIDKTIGDEVMFILPVTEEDSHAPEPIFMGQILGAYHDYAYGCDEKFAFRFGLSYGKVRAVKVEDEGYTEWSFFGEPIHVAKRLHSLPELSHPNPVVGAFGLKITPGRAEDEMSAVKNHLNFLAGFASRFSHRLAPHPFSMKGVGDVYFGILDPRGPGRSTGGVTQTVAD